MAPTAESLMADLSADVENLQSAVQSKIGSSTSGSTQYNELLALYYATQSVSANLAMHPANPFTLAKAAVAATSLVTGIPAAIGPLLTSATGKLQTAINSALEYAYAHSGTVSTFVQIEQEAQTVAKSSHFPHEKAQVEQPLRKQIKEIRKLKEAEVRVPASQVYGFLDAWLTTAEKLDDKPELSEPAKRQEHLASLATIRDGIIEAADAIGALTDRSSHLDIPEF